MDQLFDKLFDVVLIISATAVVAVLVGYVFIGTSLKKKGVVTHKVKVISQFSSLVIFLVGVGLYVNYK